MLRRVHLCALGVLVGLAVPFAHATDVTTGVLLNEMVDLGRLAQAPQPAYDTVQFSSYDRRSNQPGGPGWFANSDGFGGEPTPNFEAVVREPNEEGVGEYLICDVQGPGAIVRTWTAAISGELRVRLDDTLVYSGPADAFLRCPYRVFAEKIGLDPAIFNDTYAQNQAAYCPMPFAQRCRIVWVGKVKEIHFYQIQVRRYAAGTPVETFTPACLKTYETELRRVAEVLRSPDTECRLKSDKEPLPIEVDVPAGKKVEALKIEGPGALERLELRLVAPDRDRALRSVILHVICDEYPHAQVEAPLGDFFGAAPGVNPFDSLPFTVRPDGTMVYRFVMPFESSLRIVLDNCGDQPVTVKGTAAAGEYAWNDRSLHFYARWRVDHDLLASPKAVQDMPIVLCRGTGRYVGTAIMLLNPCRVPTPWGGWWGEGDEKVFVDNDNVPSTFGTGTEDYFNYAWSEPAIFGCAYCGQPRNDGPGNRGFVTNQRWQIVDDLPFQSRLAFYLELYPHEPTPNFSYARIGYYYARPGAIDDHLAITDEDVRPLALRTDWQPVAEFAMRGAVYYPAEDVVQPGAQTTFESDGLWAGGKLLVWHPRKVGDELTLKFPAQEEGPYRLHLALALNASGGRVSMKLDGAPVSFGGTDDVLDLHVPYRVLSRQFQTEQPATLTAGDHLLTLVFAGGPSGGGEPTIGVDYLAVQKINK